MASEQQIQKKITTYLTSKGAYVVKVITATKSGIPDILGCYKGRFFAIEVKLPSTKNNVSALQKYNIDIINSKDGRAIVAWEIGQVEDLIDLLDKTL